MRKLIGLLLFAVMILAAADAAGSYKGTWSGAGSGDCRLTLTKAADDWKGEFAFTMDGAEIVAQVSGIQVEGTRVTFVAKYDLDGNGMASTLTGELKENKLEGTYRAATAADGTVVDEGTWTATLQK